MPEKTPQQLLAEQQAKLDECPQMMRPLLRAWGNLWLRLFGSQSRLH